ncbi:DEP domain-containing protein 1B-like isoform X2 [Sycon ciliatum]|uniref:DEP domain-containing protein 1B-like isoform X2 n=1 Tax=Sycon ciliatum TaxID=27933 RepID=UPI0031F7091A
MKRTPSKRPQFLATRQWNHIVTSFQDHVPIKPVRYRLRLYYHCFTGAQAVAWLKQFFNESGGYGTVTTSQVEKFCQKLLEMGIIVDAVRGLKGNRKFSESGGRTFSAGPQPYCLTESVLKGRISQKSSQQSIGSASLKRSDSVKSSHSVRSKKLTCNNHMVNVQLTTSQSSVNSLGGLPMRRSSSLPFAVENRIDDKTMVSAPVLPTQQAPAQHTTSNGSVFQEAQPTTNESMLASALPPLCRARAFSSAPSSTVARASVVAVGSLDDVLSLLGNSQDEENLSPTDDQSVGWFDEGGRQNSIERTRAYMALSTPLMVSSVPNSVWDPCSGKNCDTISIQSGHGSIHSSPSSLTSCRQDATALNPAEILTRRHTIGRTPVRATKSMPQTTPMQSSVDSGDSYQLRRESPLQRTNSIHTVNSNSMLSGHSRRTGTTDTFARCSDTWKEIVLSRLLQCVEIPTLEAIIHCVLVDGNHIAANCGFPADSPTSEFVPLSQALEKRRRSWPSRVYPHVVPPLFDCEWSGVHAMCPRSTGGVNISYTPLICSAMDRLAHWPQKGHPTCCDFWLERGIEDIIPTIAQHFRRVVDCPVIPSAFYPLFAAVYPLLVRKKHTRAIEALQHCLLLLPPERRVLLERILCFLSSCHANQQLVLDPASENIDVLLDALVPCLLQLRCDTPLAIEAKDVVGFMSMQVADVFKVPKGIVEELQCHSSPADFDTSSEDSCSRVGDVDVTSQTTNISELSLLQLLDILIAGVNMTEREQKRRLREFRRVYPNLYLKRFPAADSAAPRALNLKRSSQPLNKRRRPSFAAATLQRVGVRLHKSFKTASAFPRPR